MRLWKIVKINECITYLTDWCTKQPRKNFWRQYENNTMIKHWNYVWELSSRLERELVQVTCTKIAWI